MSTKPINWIHPDENQPRTHFDQRALKGLSASIKTVGIINPIEVDTSGKIITGERRWRAAKMAGYKEVEEGKEFVINKTPMDKYQRLERQMIENIQQSSIDTEGENMDAVDTAEGYRDMLEEMNRVSYGAVPHRSRDKGIKFLARRLGIDPHIIYRSLKLLEESVPIKKALRRGEITKSEIEEAQHIKDPEVKEIVKQRLLKREISGHKNIRAIAKMIREHPEKKEQIVKIKFDASADSFSEFTNSLNRFSHALKKIRLKDIADPMFHHLAEGSVQELIVSCQSWLEDKEVDVIEISPTSL